MKLIEMRWILKLLQIVKLKYNFDKMKKELQIIDDDVFEVRTVEWNTIK